MSFVVAKVFGSIFVEFLASGILKYFQIPPTTFILYFPLVHLHLKPYSSTSSLIDGYVRVYFRVIGLIFPKC
jgi:hypothetical protein